MYDIDRIEIDKSYFSGSEKFNSIKKIIKEELIQEYVRYIENITYIITTNENEYIAEVLINGYDILKELNEKKNYNEEYIINWI